MRIGIDISQLAYGNTGVANYLEQLVEQLIKLERNDEFILFYSSLRRNFQFSIFNFQSNPNVQIKQFKYPPTFLDLIWNKLHICPIELFIGPVDVFITSDWTEPPAIKARKMTIIYDMIVYKYPEETDKKIVATQKRKLHWAKKEDSAFLCISESTKKDAEQILHIAKEKLFVIYPGIN